MENNIIIEVIYIKSNNDIIQREGEDDDLEYEAETEIDLDNLEGMTFGPRFADGSQTLFLVSDDNFNAEQTTQLLLFRLS